jgi:hypothetical protein
MKWYPPLDWVNYADSKLFLEDYTLFEKYCLVLYSGVMIFSGEELGPVNSIEMFYISAGKIICVLINVLVIGDVLSLVLIISKKDSEYQKHLDTTNGLMQALEFEDQLEHKIRRFMSKTQATGELKNELTGFYN